MNPLSTYGTIVEYILIIKDISLLVISAMVGSLSSYKITYVTLLADESIHPRYEEALSIVEKELLDKRYPMYISGKEVYSDKGEFEKRSPIDTSILIGRFQRGSRGSCCPGYKGCL
jgi:hypothetical protein